MQKTREPSRLTITGKSAATIKSNSPLQRATHSFTTQSLKQHILFLFFTLNSNSCSSAKRVHLSSWFIEATHETACVQRSLGVLPPKEKREGERSDGNLFLEAGLTDQS